MQNFSIDKLRLLAAEQGFSLLGTLSARQIEQALAPQEQNLKTWQDSGYAAEMSYMNRDSELFVTPEKFLQDTKSIVSLVIPYSNKSDHPAKEGYGRVARYAWGSDYHQVIRQRLAAVIKDVERNLGRQISSRVFTDAVPLLERALAARAGNGFFGKNSMIIRPGYGSYFFLAEILWDVELEEVEIEYFPGLANSIDKRAIAGGGCGGCSSCISSCPTGAILNSGVVDSSKCISYLTIEKRGEFLPNESAALGDWIFGCDICQEVCPFNQEAEHDVLSEFEGDTQYINLKDVLSIDCDQQFKTKYGSKAIVRTKREGLLRNACAVVANTNYYPAIPELSRILQIEGNDTILNSASFALSELRKTATGADLKNINEALERSSTRLGEIANT